MSLGFFEQAVVGGDQMVATRGFGGGDMKQAVGLFYPTMPVLNYFRAMEESPAPSRNKSGGHRRASTRNPQL